MTAETAGRDDLSELAALLDEIRAVWRAADQPQRDRIRRGVMVVLRGNRASAEPLASSLGPLQVTDDGWFTERAGEFELMDRDQLLHEARRWAFDYQQVVLGAMRATAGTAALARDISRRLAKAKYLARSGGKTCRSDDLKVVLDDCVTCGDPGELVRDGYVSCQACDDAAAAQKPGADPGAADALFALAKEG
jgi:hypothetical protein